MQGGRVRGRQGMQGGLEAIWLVQAPAISLQSHQHLVCACVAQAGSFQPSILTGRCLPPQTGCAPRTASPRPSRTTAPAAAWSGEPGPVPTHRPELCRLR